jgi:5-formyltetrahydrofolate cyclo-ligase
MGGGHYDRCFGFLLQRRWLRPKLIGVGYQFQAIETLARKAWDVPLQGAVTDNQTYRFKPDGHMQ